MPHSVGVWQGGNMASLLFLFLVQAFHQALEKECEHQSQPLPFLLSREPDAVLMQGQLTTVPKPETATGGQTTISNMLLADDEAFVLKAVMKCANSPIIKETFVKRGLLMHVGTVDINGQLAQSKTRAMCHQHSHRLQPWSNFSLKQFTLVMMTASTLTAPMNSGILVAACSPPFQMNETLKFGHSKQQNKPGSLRISVAHHKMCGSNRLSSWQSLQTLHCMAVNVGP